MTELAQTAPQKTTLETITGAPALQMRHLATAHGESVLYVHGATFPSALSVGYHFADGEAWEDSLNAAGFDVWALDFEGFGGSAAPAAYGKAATARPIPLRSQDGARQIARAVQHILKKTGRKKLSIIAHSWGGVPAACYATNHARFIERLVLFAPVVRRQPAALSAGLGNSLPDPAKLPAWRMLTVAEQLARFVSDTPQGEANVLAEPALDHWGPAWLATDPNSATHTPPAARVPGGPQADIITMWTGVDLYDPALLRGNILFVRGEWDSVSSAVDANTFKARANHAMVTISTIPRSGHLAHLETDRARLWAQVNTFLKAAKP
jgi:pimeloyl-ACP methyl ester carboxylesterase